MASLHRQPERPNWFVAYTDAAGKRHFKSTGTSNREEAEAVCAKIEESVGASRKGRLTQKRARSIIENLVSEVMESQGDSLKKNPTRDFLNSWLAEMKRQITPSTYNSYKAITNQFIKFLGGSASENISTVELAAVRGYRDQLAETYSSGTVNNHLKMLRLAFESAAQQDLIDRNPAKLVKNLARTDKQERNPFTPEQLKALLGVATGDWKTAIYIGVYTGLRLGDVTSLRWVQCDLVRMEISKKTKKTGRIVIIPIARPLARLLESLPSPPEKDSPICPSLTGIRINQLSAQFHTLLVQAGLLERRDYRTRKRSTGRRKYTGLSFHCLRHNATSMLKNNGVSDAVARDIIGHSSEAVSRNYTHIASETKRAAFEGIFDLANL